MAGRQRRVRRMRAAAVSAVALALAACRVDAAVVVDARPDGSGTVGIDIALDEAARRRLGDPASALAFDDLTAAGWSVSEPAPTTSGGLTVSLARPFATPQEGAALVSSIGGADGPVRDVRLTVDRRFARTDSTFTATVDLSAGIDAFADPELEATLGGPALGLDPAELERQAGAPLGEVFHLTVAPRLPGGTDVATGAQPADGVWQVRFGERVEIAATAQRWNVANLALGGTSVLSGAALVGVLARRRRQPVTPGP